MIYYDWLTNGWGEFTKKRESVEELPFVFHLPFQKEKVLHQDSLKNVSQLASFSHANFFYLFLMGERFNSNPENRFELLIHQTDAFLRGCGYNSTRKRSLQTAKWFCAMFCIIPPWSKRSNTLIAMEHSKGHNVLLGLGSRLKVQYTSTWISNTRVSLSPISTARSK